MLIGTLTALLIGAIVGTSGGAGASQLLPGDEVNEGVDDLIDDEERRERAKGVAEDANAFRAATNEAFSALAARFAELTDDRSTGAADFEAVVAELDAEARWSQTLDLRYRLKNELTEDEWTALYGRLTVPE